MASFYACAYVNMYCTFYIMFHRLVLLDDYGAVDLYDETIGQFSLVF